MPNPESFFKKSLKNAEKIVNDPQKMNLLWTQLDRLLDKKNNVLHLVREDLLRLKRMVLAYQRGELVKIPWKSVLWATAALLYLVNPMDFIPDFLMGPGFLDDMGIIMFCLRNLHKDLEEFDKWEKERADLKDG